jgi:hypothetical protein
MFRPRRSAFQAVRSAVRVYRRGPVRLREPALRLFKNSIRRALSLDSTECADHEMYLSLFSFFLWTAAIPFRPRSAVSDFIRTGFRPSGDCDDCRLASERRISSLNRHALGKIARLIDIATEGHCQMVSEQLQRNHRENRAETINRAWDFNNVRGKTFQLLCPVA